MTGTSLVSGMKVRYLPQPEWGVGHLLAYDAEAGRAAVIFPGRGDEPVLVSTKQRALERVELSPGAPVLLVDGGEGSVVERVTGAGELFVYRVEHAGERVLVPEERLRAALPSGDLEAMLRAGRFGDPRDYRLRAQTLQLDDERRCDALGAMFASRVRVQPHQIGVVQRVLSAPRPRFVLADEVGLGKTIEAGMIFSALRLTGLCKRVLVVTPSHLTVQWLIELQHKFNQRFSLLDGSRLRDEDAAIDKEVERKTAKIKDRKKAERVAQVVKQRISNEENPWLTQHLAVTSLELLVRNEKHRAAAAAPGAFWDLVIIDEAHHLKAEKAFQVAQALASNCWGLLLLTATPMHVDPAEYQKLLQLLDARTAPDAERLGAMLDKQAGLAAPVRALMAGDRASIDSLYARFPDDHTLRELTDPETILAHVAETYSLSEQLVRNRRAVVGGFAERRLHKHKVSLRAEELRLRETLLARIRPSLHGAALATFVRRMDSSLAALRHSTQSVAALAPVADEIGAAMAAVDFGDEAKAKAFQQLLASIWAKEPEAKVLVFTEARDTLDLLQARLHDSGHEALVYHGDLSLVERDRQVARFRDPEGPKVLVCTEVGGEGRNFQFAHHLVHYDLPWSPAAIEQRIGRLDRIGQTQTVDIHVFDVPGTFASLVLELMDGAVSVFRETVGGLDAVLETIEPEIAGLIGLSVEEREAYGRSLAARVSAAREQLKRGYDPLLDMRSFDAPRLRALLDRACERLDIDSEEEDLAGSLWVVARDLDERLEDTVVSLAKKAGIQVDTDEHVDAFQAAFHFGYAVNVEALAGLDLHQDRTVLGTFWRETAIEQEEIEYFATGHPIVEALFGMVRDGPFGRLALGRFRARGRADPRRGFELHFHVTTPDPADTDPGARVPARQLSRFWPSQLIRVVLDWTSGHTLSAAPDLASMLDHARLEELSPGDEEAMSEAFAPMGVRALDFGREVATHLLDKQRQRVRAAIVEERDERLEKLTRALVHQGVSQEERHAVLASEAESYDRLRAALDTTRLQLDSMLAFLIA